MNIKQHHPHFAYVLTQEISRVKNQIITLLIKENETDACIENKQGLKLSVINLYVMPQIKGTVRSDIKEPCAVSSVLGKTSRSLFSFQTVITLKGFLSKTFSHVIIIPSGKE